MKSHRGKNPLQGGLGERGGGGLGWSDLNYLYPIGDHHKKAPCQNSTFSSKHFEETPVVEENPVVFC